MRPAEPLITQDSSYYNYEPSKGARDYWLYPLCAGDFTYQPGYHLERASYDSWLLEVIAEGSAEIESEGRVFQAHSGDAVLLDCHKPHGYRSSSGWRALWAHFDGMPAKGNADMMSEYHFIRVFSQTIGVTPRQYIIASRMGHARYLLAHTDWTGSAIAAQVGYASESMFCLTFKKTQGMTPTAYRMGREENA